MDKTHHRSFLPSFHKFGGFICKIMIPCVCIFVIVVAPAYLSSNHNDYYYGSSHIFGSATQLGKDTEAIEDVFGKSDTYVLLIPRGDTAKATELTNALKEIPQVDDIISFVDLAGAQVPYEYLDEDTLSRLESEHYSRMVLSVDVDYEGSETFDLVKTLRDTASKYYPDEYYLAGQGVSTYDGYGYSGYGKGKSGCDRSGFCSTAV